MATSKRTKPSKKTTATESRATKIKKATQKAMTQYGNAIRNLANR